MIDFNQEKIKEKEGEMPEIIRAAIQKSEWESRIRRIATINNLRVDQGANLEKLTKLTMLGLIDSNNFLQEVIKNLNVSREEGRKITIQVGDEIFQPIKSEIIKITRRESGLPEERDEIDEIIYGKEEDQLGIYDVESSLEVDEEEVISREQITNDLKKDIEIIPNEEEVNSEPEIDNGDMSKKLEAPTQTTTEDSTLDPYREPLM